MRSLSTVAVLVVVLAAWCPSAAGAQGLERVDSLARDGRVSAARSLLLSWFGDAADSADRNETQRALWLRGILTLDPTQAEVDFTRLALEYPGGPFSDQALLRLARAARARGELAEAARRYRRLARDYPGSPGRIEARSWLDENAAAIAAVELRREAARPAAPAVPGGTRAAPDSGGAPPSGGGPVDTRELDSPPPDSGPFTVQIGAFGEPEGARDLMERLAEAGITARLVTVAGSDLIRVRAGRFDDAGDATRLHDRVVSAGFDAMVVADAQREDPYT